MSASSPNPLHIKHLKNSQFLQGAPDALISQVASIAYELELKAKEILINKGEKGDALYVILEGSVYVHDEGIQLNHHSRGQVIGEIAALGSLLRTASVTAAENSLFLVIEKDALFNVISGNPNFIGIIMNMLCRREESLASNIMDRSRRIVSLEKELEIGRQIQAGFLPRTIPEVEGWQINHYFKAAREVAGDFYDVFDIEGHTRIGIVIADVCDKGVGAALFMTLFRSLLRSTAKLHEYTEVSPDSKAGLLENPELILKRSVQFANNYIAETHGHTSMFASIFFGLLDPQSGHLYYINAGHEAPYIIQPGEVKQTLETTGPVVGLFAGSEYGIAETCLQPGETLFAYTDGATDIVNEQQAAFGLPRLESLLLSVEGEELIQTVVDDLNRYKGSEAQFDDITMLAVSRSGE
ncbi:MAG: SpoIIE family protein phosphatase [Gammaproteobacteria bacterium]|nr:SpoIIE family protein phosphatase [Gammaproteobacteria bacterium]